MVVAFTAEPTCPYIAYLSSFGNKSVIFAKRPRWKKVIHAITNMTREKMSVQYSTQHCIHAAVTFEGMSLCTITLWQQSTLTHTAMQFNAIKQPTGGMNVLTNTSKQDDCHSYLSIGSFDSTVATKIKMKRQFLHLLLILQNSQKWWSIPLYPVKVSAAEK